MGCGAAQQMIQGWKIDGPKSGSGPSEPPHPVLTSSWDVVCCRAVHPSLNLTSVSIKCNPETLASYRQRCRCQCPRHSPGAHCRQ